MTDKTIKVAFALSNENIFENDHFGNADKYHIYQIAGEKMVFSEEIVNPHKSFDESQKHGVRKKGLAIVDLLKKSNVNVLVSKRFGKNIQVVNSYFVPVIIKEDTPDDVSEILLKHKMWLYDELKSNAEEYKLFTIDKGIMKTKIKREEE